MDRSLQGVSHAILFCCGLLVYLWVRDRDWSLVLLGLLVAGALWLLWERGRLGAGDLGLGWEPCWAALRRWWAGLLASSLLTALVMGCRLADPALWWDGFWYFLWALVQQLVYQNLVAQPLCQARRRGCWWAGTLFAAVHMPNPVLVPATFAWGLVSCRMYQRVRSVVVLALFQAVLSSALYWTVPPGWHRGFRVGISYLRALQAAQ